MRDVTVTCNLIRAGEPTANGNIYSQEVLEAMVTQIGSGSILVYPDPCIERRTLSDSCGVVTSGSVVDGRLVIDVKLMDMHVGSAIEAALDSFDVAPDGYGTVAPDGTVSDYELRGVSFVPVRK